MVLQNMIGNLMAVSWTQFTNSTDLVNKELISDYRKKLYVLKKRERSVLKRIQKLNNMGVWSDEKCSGVDVIFF